ncbi:isoleucine--tRNA ligase [Clostridia bacterium OttesenSCG-928-F22]|nr:isoleucine--tRNA ligase [Clostridia bacterium OttesenSCG-928-F22]
MYQKVSTDMNFKQREDEVLAFWKENEIFKKSMQKNEGKEAFTFYDGPPTANGKPHIGHILTRCIKDIIPRYKTMQGYDVLRKAGWDTHGLPVELEVEKLLNLDGKEQIEQFGVEAFIKECKKSVWKYQAEWEDMSERVGFWADMEHPYITYENYYIESVWWSLKQIHEKGLLYKGHKIVPYCPRCGTALSSHEVAQGYQDVTEKSIFVRFKEADGNGYFLAWTTTPWTLPSNVSLCVNPKEEYVRVLCEGTEYIMAKALVEQVLGENTTILETVRGEQLVGKKYQPLFAFNDASLNAYFVTADSYVTLNDGTGIVHVAPAFGEDDARVGRDNSLPFVQLVDAAGKLTGGTDWDGTFVKDADPLIIEQLKQNGLLHQEMEYTHNYPFCWRCDTPLIYYARSSWFIAMTKLRDALLKNNRAVNWLPQSIGEGRMGNFLENVVDWGLSRERYWGTPLPVWECECGHIHVVGSVEELCSMGKDVPADIELHKPYIDRVKLTCEKCGGEMTRVSEVIDCWYDSGAMPFAQWHYPFENKEVFEQRFPANYISEAIDQTRGWFYTLLAISTCLFDETPFENCIVMGHVQDANGQKMSKHKGNVVDPWTILDAQGADAVRWFFYTSSNPWLPVRFSPEGVSEVQRKFMGTLWNTYAFYTLYAEIDQFDPTKYRLEDCTLTVMDKWALSRLNTLVKQTADYLNNYKLTEAGREIQAFVDDLSNWYVRRCRERYWGSDMDADKISAYMTLYTCLETLSRLCAPFVPFMSEQIYRNIVCSVDASAPASVHLCAYPVCNAGFIDEALERDMDVVLQVVVLGRAARNNTAIKNRQPIGKMFVKCESGLPETYTSIIADELNVKHIEFVKDMDAFTTYSIKPQMRTLGPKYGKLLGKIGAHLASCDTKQAVAAVQNGGTYSFDVDGEKVDLTLEDMLIETVQQQGFAVEEDRGVTVVMDTNLTEALLEEGFVREIISKVQTMRKEAGFEVTDHITLYYGNNKKVADIITRNSAEICSNVLADEIKEGSAGYQKEWNINKENILLAVEKK